MSDKKPRKVHKPVWEIQVELEVTTDPIDVGGVALPVTTDRVVIETDRPILNTEDAVKYLKEKGVKNAHISVASVRVLEVETVVRREVTRINYL